MHRETHVVLIKFLSVAYLIFFTASRNIFTPSVELTGLEHSFLSRLLALFSPVMLQFLFTGQGVLTGVLIRLGT